MAEQHRATPEQWARIERMRHHTEFSCLLELIHRVEALEAVQQAKPNHPEKPDSSLVERVEDANESKLLTLLSKQLEHCYAQGYTDTEAAQAVIDSTADWFEDTLSRIGMSPAMIPNLLRWQAHQHEYLQ